MLEKLRNLFRKDKTPTQTPSPIDRMAVSASVENLLGNSSPSPDYEGDRHRFTNKEAAEITDKLKRMINPKIIEETYESELLKANYQIKKMELSEETVKMLKERLLSDIKKIAENNLSGKQAWVIYELANILTYGYYENKVHISPPKEFNMFAKIIYHLTHAVIFLEGNLPPNDMGYIADETVSLNRRDEHARESLQQAYKLIEQDNNILGPDSKEIYNKIAQRCFDHRPKFMGRPASYEPIPLFNAPPLTVKPSL